jgi:hypothetical protein
MKYILIILVIALGVADIVAGGSMTRRVVSS